MGSNLVLEEAMPTHTPHYGGTATLPTLQSIEAWVDTQIEQIDLSLGIIIE